MPKHPQSSGQHLPYLSHLAAFTQPIPQAIASPAQFQPFQFQPFQFQPLSFTTPPTDPLFTQQWHLLNTGQTGGTPGIDLNVVQVWQDYTGKGVRVSLIDDGVQYNHLDLAKNYDTTQDADVDELDGDPNPGQFDFHGTAVAGIIAAVAGNGIGGVGVAPDATLVGIRLGFPGVFGPYDQDVDALRRMAAFDVVNNSWGYIDPFSDNFLDTLLQSYGEAMQAAAQEGRNGLGTVIVFAGGNDRTVADNSNYHNLANSRFSIAVAALNHNGVHTFYSNRGANLLVSAFGGGEATPPGEFDPLLEDGIVTTDRLGLPGYNQSIDPFAASDYTNSFNGTSAAAPMVSGIVALMLEANPRLGWRDVQEILAYSARQVDSTNSGWSINGAKNWNGGGLHISHDYGFGLINAHAAVRLAETWTEQSTSANEAVVQANHSPQLAIPDGVDQITDTITVNTGVVNAGLTVEQVEIEVDISHPWIGDLEVTLTAPSGTKSTLVERPGVTLDNRTGLGLANLKFTFSSTRHWGETATGNWTISVRDRLTGWAGTLNQWQLRLYGSPANANDTYIYTDEFSTYKNQPARTTLTDTNGIDTINAAATTSNIILNLAPGSGNTIANTPLMINADTIIENVFAGDGNDSITGNQANNILNGERGNDRLNGLAGQDTLNGGKDNDQLHGGIGNDTLIGNAGNDSITSGQGRDRIGFATGKSFTTADLGVDTIVDFVSGIDTIGLSKTTFQTLKSAIGVGFSAANEFATVVNDNAAAISNALIVYSQSTGNLFYNANGTQANFGSGAKFATFRGIPPLVASDFVLEV